MENARAGSGSGWRAPGVPARVRASGARGQGAGRGRLGLGRIAGDAASLKGRAGN